MVQEIMWGEVFLSQKAEAATLEQIINAKPSRCVGAEGLGMAAERLADMLSKI